MKAAITDIRIGQEISGRGTTGHIAEKTSNSIQLFLKAKSSKGICSFQWVTLEEFNKEFTVKS